MIMPLDETKYREIIDSLISIRETGLGHQDT